MKTRKLFTRLTQAALSILIFPSSLAAQDFSSIPYNGVMAGVLHKINMRNIYGKEALPSRQSQTPVPQTPSTTSRNSSVSDRTDYTYIPNAAISSQTKQDFIERIAKQNPQAARQIALFMEQHDFEAIYQNITKPFGLDSHNLADTMSAYLLLAWLIANDDFSNPSVQSVNAVKADIATKFNPMMSSNISEQKQSFNEELMYLFVIVHSGWQSASDRSPQTLQDYSDRIHQMWQTQFGQDLRQLKLTPQGLVPI